MRNFFKRRRNFIIKEADLINVLSILERRNLGRADMAIGRLRGYEKGNWVVSIYVTDSQWRYVERELKKIEINWH